MTQELMAKKLMAKKYSWSRGSAPGLCGRWLRLPSCC